jgi:hypothetical protein
MTNASALVLALVIAAALTWDGAMNDWAASLFIGRKGLELLGFLAFWR